eukprot:TRINITY_DN2256_c0_g1_i1.p1 TRINITY_DN2256_c0_g1~~TRINITY_DN2256_c0_g1_i1.p1  ORF type:complete len:270 (+),score=89.79 TRINITY_DN2256_c0_g1_i1:60-869(+)
MSPRIKDTFTRCNKDEKRPVFVAYLMAGYKNREETVPTMMALQEGGADIIELGVPFTDPIGDGPTIQTANQIALENKVTLRDCFQFVRDARSKGVTVPIVLMGYYNPLLNYGEMQCVKDASSAGADGFIVVDLPPEEAEMFRDHCKQADISYVPLVAPTTSDKRIKKLTSLADSFVYCVSLNGVTGQRTELPTHLPAFVDRVRGLAGSVPLAVGFGISTKAQFDSVGKIADGVVIGSAIIKAIGAASENNLSQSDSARQYALSISSSPC